MPTKQDATPTNTPNGMLDSIRSNVLQLCTTKGASNEKSKNTHDHKKLPETSTLLGSCRFMGHGLGEHHHHCQYTILKKEKSVSISVIHFFDFIAGKVLPLNVALDTVFYTNFYGNRTNGFPSMLKMLTRIYTNHPSFCIGSLIGRLEQDFVLSSCLFL